MLEWFTIRPAGTRFEQGQKGFRDGVGRNHVGFQCSAERVRRRAALFEHHARVVDENVKSAEFLLEVGGQSGHIVRVGNIQFHEMRVYAFSAQSISGGFAFRFVPRPENDGNALLSQLPGDFQPQTFVRARNQGHFVCGGCHVNSFFCVPVRCTGSKCNCDGYVCSQMQMPNSLLFLRVACERAVSHLYAGQHVGNGGLRQALFQRGLGLRKKAAHDLLHGSADVTKGIGPLWRQSEQGSFPHGLIRVQEGNGVGQSHQSPAAPAARLRRNQSGTAQLSQHAPDHDGVGGDAAGNELRRQQVGMLVREQGQDMDGDGETAVGTHKRIWQSVYS